MPDRAEPSADAPDPAASALAALSARVEIHRRGQVVVDYANRGVPIPEIAARLGISEAEAHEKLRDALARRLPEPEVFAALQMSRLNEALLVAFAAMEAMGLRAVDRVLRIVQALNRLHAAARPLALAVAAGDMDAPTALAPPPAPRERNQTVAQPIEKPENRSQTLGRPATSEGAASPGDAAAPARGERGEGLAQFLDILRAAAPVGRATPPVGKAPVPNRPCGASVHALAVAGA